MNGARVLCILAPYHIAIDCSFRPFTQKQGVTGNDLHLLEVRWFVIL